MKIYIVVLTTLALLLVLFPCLVTGSGGDGTQGPDETDYLYYLIVKCEVGVVWEGENSEALCLTRIGGVWRRGVVSFQRGK